MPRHALTEQEISSLIDAVREAEEKTSGEIRIHIDSHTEPNNAKRAWEVFHNLGMTETAERNAVLLHINFEDKYLTILGDEGIHQKVSQQFWDTLHDRMTALFAENKLCEGIRLGVTETGKKLAEYFPPGSNPKNELPDEISYS